MQSKLIKLSSDDIGKLFLFESSYYGSVLFSEFSHATWTRYGQQLKTYHLTEIVVLLDFVYQDNITLFVRLLFSDGLVGWMYLRGYGYDSAKIQRLSTTDEETNI